MTIPHSLTGYDKQSSALQREFEIPADLVLEARHIAGASPAWQDAPGAFALNEQSAEAMSALIRWHLDAARYDWFLEPVAT